MIWLANLSTSLARHADGQWYLHFDFPAGPGPWRVAEWDGAKRRFVARLYPPRSRYGCAVGPYRWKWLARLGQWRRPWLSRLDRAMGG